MQTFTQTVSAIEGNIDFQGIENPAFVKAYHAVQEASQKKQEAIYWDEEKDDTQTDDAVIESKTAQAKEEGFFTELDGDTHTLSTDIGRIITRQVKEVLLSGETAMGARKEVTVELF